jgi:hypothetical protein
MGRLMGKLQGQHLNGLLNQEYSMYRGHWSTTPHNANLRSLLAYPPNIDRVYGMQVRY